MKSLHWFSILLACSPALVSAQNEQAAALRSGTKINAALESTLDARAAKPGDQVRAKVTKDIKQNHQTIVHKGDRLVGHITKVENDTKAKSGSQVGVAFDQLVSGDSTMQLNAVLTSIVSARLAGSSHRLRHHRWTCPVLRRLVEAEVRLKLHPLPEAWSVA